MTFGKGVISTVKDKEVKVEQMFDKKLLSPYLAIPTHLKDVEIKKGDKAVYIIFEDGSGVLLAILEEG